MKLAREFYLNPDVVAVSKSLLGKYLFTCVDGVISGGIITETEAYAGVNDKASHAFGGKRTARTEIMFWQGGTAYVYLCYGIHSLFNVVTNIDGIPHAVLVRAIYPMYGTASILERRKAKKLDDKFTVGPGKVATALGIHFSQSGKDLLDKEIWIEDRGFTIPENLIHVGSRIGVDYAGEDAKLPYRFWVEHKELKKLIEKS